MKKMGLLLAILAKDGAKIKPMKSAANPSNIFTRSPAFAAPLSPLATYREVQRGNMPAAKSKKLLKSPVACQIPKSKVGMLLAIKIV
jgi:hypothetical protein